MGKIIKLTESDIYRIVKRVINEQELPKYDYIFTREDGETSATQGQKLFFVQNGSTFDVWMEEYTGDGTKGRYIKTGKTLPTKDEIGLVFEKETGRFKSNLGAIKGNEVAKLVTPPMEQSKSNWIFYVNEQGVPTKGNLSKMTYPIKGMLDKRGTPVKLKDGSEISGNEYFVIEKPSRKNVYGKGLTISIKNIEESKHS